MTQWAKEELWMNGDKHSPFYDAKCPCCRELKDKAFKRREYKANKRRLDKLMKSEELQ